MVCAFAVDAGDLFVGADDASNVADLAEVPVAGVAGGGADDAPLRVGTRTGEVSEGPAATALDDALVVLDEFGDGIFNPGKDDVPHIEGDASVVV